MKKAIMGVLCLLGLSILSSAYAAPLTCNTINGMWVLGASSPYHWRTLGLNLSSSSGGTFSGSLHYIYNGLDGHDAFNGATCMDTYYGPMISIRQVSPFGYDNLNIGGQGSTLSIMGSIYGGMLNFNDTLTRING